MFPWEIIFKGNKTCVLCRQVVSKPGLTVIIHRGGDFLSWAGGEGEGGVTRWSLVTERGRVFEGIPLPTPNKKTLHDNFSLKQMNFSDAFINLDINLLSSVNSFHVIFSVAEVMYFSIGILLITQANPILIMSKTFFIFLLTDLGKFFWPFLSIQVGVIPWNIFMGEQATPSRTALGSGRYSYIYLMQSTLCIKAYLH